MVVQHLHFLGFVISLFITVIIVILTLLQLLNCSMQFNVNAGVLPFSDSSPHPTSWGDEGLQGHVESCN